MADQKYQILNMAHNPPDFPSWPNDQKRDFYKRVVEWHDYISGLMKDGHVLRAWGTQKMPGRVRAHGTKTALVALYEATFDKFSELVIKDPLWNSAIYMSPILKSIEGDYEDDLRRFESQKSYLEMKTASLFGEPVVKFRGTRVNIAPGGTIEVLVGSGNTPGWHDLSDEEQLPIYEKVLQMHDYFTPFREANVVSEWGTYQNCGFGILEGPTSAKGIWIAKVNSYDEFDELFQVNPMRNNSNVFTYILIPFDESRKRAKEELRIFSSRSRSVAGKEKG